MLWLLATSYLGGIPPLCCLVGSVLSVLSSPQRPPGWERESQVGIVGHCWNCAASRVSQKEDGLMSHKRSCTCSLSLHLEVLKLLRIFCLKHLKLLFPSLKSFELIVTNCQHYHISPLYGSGFQQARASQNEADPP